MLKPKTRDRLNVIHFFTIFVPSKQKDPLETAVIVTATPGLPADVDTEGAAAAAAGGPKKKKKKGLGSFLKMTDGTAPGPALQQDQAIAFELQAYLHSGTLDTEEDPLVWWKQSYQHFPRLAVLAKKYLCIPATSASSERVFSTGGNIVTCLRSSLKPDHVDRLVFLAKNL